MIIIDTGTQLTTEYGPGPYLIQYHPGHIEVTASLYASEFSRSYKVIGAEGIGVLDAARDETLPRRAREFARQFIRAVMRERQDEFVGLDTTTLEY